MIIAIDKMTAEDRELHLWMCNTFGYIIDTKPVTNGINYRDILNSVLSEWVTSNAPVN